MSSLDQNEIEDPAFLASVQRMRRYGRSRLSDRPMTQRQAEVFCWVVEFMKRNEFPPTLREIGTGLGIRSTNAVSDHLMAIERRGLIERVPVISRGIRIVRQGLQS